MNTLRKTLLACLLSFAIGSAYAETVNINSANATEIAEMITGIGPVRAEAIVAFRKANGPFASVDDLVLVKGIGQATLDKIRDQLTVD